MIINVIIISISIVISIKLLLLLLLSLLSLNVLKYWELVNRLINPFFPLYPRLYKIKWPEELQACLHFLQHFLQPW